MTNRQEKRQRCKARRRERLADERAKQRIHIGPSGEETHTEGVRDRDWWARVVTQPGPAEKPSKRAARRRMRHATAKGRKKIRWAKNGPGEPHRGC